jgi:hypothetical protein
MKPVPDEPAEGPDRETAALVAALARDAERLRLLGEGGPDWQRLRARAFCVMVVRPIARASAWCLGRIRRRLGARALPAYRAETVQEVQRRAE